MEAAPGQNEVKKHSLVQSSLAGPVRVPAAEPIVRQAANSCRHVGNHRWPLAAHKHDLSVIHGHTVLMPRLVGIVSNGQRFHEVQQNPACEGVLRFYPVKWQKSVLLLRCAQSVLAHDCIWHTCHC